ncbi:pectinesterase inhibitor 11-like [Neltuma alba]|uniref:pectinesterase inhibitor 11-like n=1 Tax=Neltuma alba TaxID=207710 RepID=UPI0010A36023|nr:pectinesterase inhibitor 11-like [Prosopis alba]
MITERLHLLFLFLATASFHCLRQSGARTILVDPTTDSNPSAATFIRTNCNATLYPGLCYSSLSPYYNAIQQDSGKLARVAIALTLTKAHRMTSYLSGLSRDADYSTNSRAASALRDCFTNLGDAVDEIRGSLKQMRQLAIMGAGGEQFRFQMSNVQTWMSAALTDEDTCTDGFEDVPEGAVKTDICDRMNYLKEFTSNALALVNSYANKEMRY